jgi:hypothetical protein
VGVSDPDADAHSAADGPDAAERAGIPDALDAEVYAEYVAAYEERLATQRWSSIEAGRRKGGAAGAAMAGAMLVVSEIVEGPLKDDAPVTVEASGEPDDVDRDGIDVCVGDVDVGAPALERLDPVTDSRRRR